MYGFTPDKEIVVLSDTRKEFDLESIYNQITDGFTLEDKGVAKLVIPEDRAPKTIITTNYTIDASARSVRRRLWFVPISTYYGEQEELTGKTPADFQGGRLLDKHIWDEKEWGAFYTTCVYCLDQYLKHGLQKFDDNVLQERQLLKVVYGEQTLLEELTSFIEEVVKNGGEVSKEEVVAFYTYRPEFERFTGYKSNWKTTTFKKVCAGLVYRINPDREGNRWFKSVNGENKDFYQVVPQE